MRHGRPNPFSFSGLSKAACAAVSNLDNVLLEASVVKALTESGTRSLPSPDSFPISDHLVRQILRRPSLDVSKKLDFFTWCSLSHNYKHSACTYSHLLRTLCRFRSLDHVVPLIASMKRDGAAVDPATFKLLVDTLIRSGKFDSALEILDHVGELGISSSLNPSVYNSVIVALVRKNQLGSALSIFSKLLKASCYDAVACNELLVALRKAGMRTDFKKVFEMVREREGFELDTWGYNICIHAFGCWGDLGTALRLFKEMKEKSLSSGSWGPDLCTYNSLIHVLCLLGKVNDALVVWEELKGTVNRPDFFTFRILIQGCGKSYRVEDALKVFDEMQCNGFPPDVIVYNSLLDTLFKARKVTEGCQLFEKMVEDGVRATCWTYNILIDGLFRNERAAAGYTLFCDLKKKGQFVDGITYSIVVLRLCKENLLEEALKLVDEMEARGFMVDLVTVTALVIELHRQGRWDWTQKLIKHIRDGVFLPEVLKWKADMEALVSRPQSKEKNFMSMFPSKGNFGDIMALLRSTDPVTSAGGDSEGAEKCNVETSNAEADLWSSSPYMDQLANEVADLGSPSSHLFSLSKGQRVQTKEVSSFDIDMVNTYLSIFLSKGKLSLACKLFEIFRDMGVDPVSYTYNSMISSFVKKGYLDEAWGVFQEMGESVCAADIATYNLIIQGLGKMGRADLASSVLDMLMKQGGYLDIVMYNTLINALGKAGRFEEANKLFEQMKSSGINPDVVTYNTLIEVHSKAGLLKDSYRFLKMMLDAGCSPNHVTDTTLEYLEKGIEKARYDKASIRPATSDEYV